MNIKTISTVRFILFIVGAVLLCALVGALLPNFLSPYVTSFVTVAALLAYIVVAAPLSLSFKFNNGIIVGGIIYYRGASMFGAASMALAVFAVVTMRVTKLLIVLEAIALFVFAIYVLLSYTAGKHVERVKEKEQKKNAVLSVLKSNALQLKIMADTLDDDAAETKNLLNKVADGIRFLSPSENPEAVALERKIIGMIAAINLNEVSSAQLKELELTINQRKVLY